MLLLLTFMSAYYVSLLYFKASFPFGMCVYDVVIFLFVYGSDCGHECTEKPERFISFSPPKLLCIHP
jgi:hypothetical protein